MSMEPYPDQVRPDLEYQAKAAAHAATQSVQRVLEPHQQRVVEERDELHEKLGKLEKFIASPMAAGAGIDEQMRLRFQYLFMSQYHMVLCERINAFSTPATA